MLSESEVSTCSACNVWQTRGNQAAGCDNCRRERELSCEQTWHCIIKECASQGRYEGTWGRPSQLGAASAPAATVCPQGACANTPDYVTAQSQMLAPNAEGCCEHNTTRALTYGIGKGKRGRAMPTTHTTARMRLDSTKESVQFDQQKFARSDARDVCTAGTSTTSTSTSTSTSTNTSTSTLAIALFVLSLLRHLLLIVPPLALVLFLAVPLELGGGAPEL